MSESFCCFLNSFSFEIYFSFRCSLFLSNKPKKILFIVKLYSHRWAETKGQAITQLLIIALNLKKKAVFVLLLLLLLFICYFLDWLSQKWEIMFNKLTNKYGWRCFIFCVKNFLICKKRRRQKKVTNVLFFLGEHLFIFLLRDFLWKEVLLKINPFDRKLLIIIFCHSHKKEDFRPP